MFLDDSDNFRLSVVLDALVQGDRPAALGGIRHQWDEVRAALKKMDDEWAASVSEAEGFVCGTSHVRFRDMVRDRMTIFFERVGRSGAGRDILAELLQDEAWSEWWPELIPLVVPAEEHRAAAIVKALALAADGHDLSGVASEMVEIGRRLREPDLVDAGFDIMRRNPGASYGDKVWGHDTVAAAYASLGVDKEAQAIAIAALTAGDADPLLAIVEKAWPTGLPERVLAGLATLVEAERGEDPVLAVVAKLRDGSRSGEAERVVARLAPASAVIRSGFDAIARIKDPRRALKEMEVLALRIRNARAAGQELPRADFELAEALKRLPVTGDLWERRLVLARGIALGPMRDEAMVDLACAGIDCGETERAAALLPFLRNETQRNRLAAALEARRRLLR